jgi:hypothetical protein
MLFGVDGACVTGLFSGDVGELLELLGAELSDVSEQEDE